ncbi:hypothetical protein H8959_012131 [Pygathrix nigripes]
MLMRLIAKEEDASGPAVPSDRVTLRMDMECRLPPAWTHSSGPRLGPSLAPPQAHPAPAPAPPHAPSEAGPGPSGSPDSDLPGPGGAGGKVRAGALRAAAGGAGRGPAVLPFAAPGFSSASLSCLPPPGGGATLGAGTDPRVGDAGRPWAGDPRVEGAGRPWALTSVCGPWSQVHSVSLEAVTVPPLPPQLSWTQGQGEAGRQVRRTQRSLSTASSFLLREVGSQPRNQYHLRHGAVPEGAGLLGHTGGLGGLGPHCTHSPPGRGHQRAPAHRYQVWHRV